MGYQNQAFRTWARGPVATLQQHIDQQGVKDVAHTTSSFASGRPSKVDAQQRDHAGVDATTRQSKLGRPRRRKGQDKTKTMTCYECRGFNHMARDCWSNASVREPQLDIMPAKRKEVVSALSDTIAQCTLSEEEKQQHEHACLHWSFCYEHGCRVHYSTKQDAGYFPSRPQKHRQRRDPSVEPVTGYRQIPVPDELREIHPNLQVINIDESENEELDGGVEIQDSAGGQEFPS